MKEITRYSLIRLRTSIMVLVLLGAILRIDAAPVLPASTRMFVLTCTPGADLYSTFGHSAIRIAGEMKGQSFDLVYNYGTFDFTDDFYFQFCMGKLNYTLSRSTFAEFQLEYIESNRGIFEQELLLDSADKQNLFDLLEENHLPENRYYRYDFFYDNCSTRIRDILMKATNNAIGFTYVYARPYSFRNAIDRYLTPMPWADFGIDLILGCPTDKIMEKNQGMFLPDSLMNELNYATYKDGALVSPSRELLPAELDRHNASLITPVRVTFSFLILLVVSGLFWLKRKGRTFLAIDRVLFGLSGLLGCVIVFLWLFTDHHQTIWNLNILWANPANLLIAFSGKTMRTKIQRWLNIYLIVLLLLLLLWFILPQQLSIAAIPLVVSLLFVMIKCVRPQILMKIRNNTKDNS